MFRNWRREVTITLPGTSHVVLKADSGPTMSALPGALLLRSVFVAALGGLLFGFDTAVIAGTTQSLTRVFGLHVGELGITVSSALWGTVIGAMVAGPLGGRFGGRNSLLFLGSCYLVSSLGCSVSTHWTELLVFRFVTGLGIGGSSVIGPVYIAEVAPAAWRGRLVGAFQINIVIGILAAYFSNYLVGLAALGEFEWRWQLGIAAAPAALFLILLIGNPPSPRWLVARGRPDEARMVLERLKSANPEAELKEIIASLETLAGAESERLFQRQYRRPIFLAVALAVFNQTVGINAVLYYLNDIFAMAGFDRSAQNLQAVAVGAINLVGTLIALTLIDRIGRRTLLLVGSVGLAICLAGITTVFATQSHQGWLLFLVVGYVGFFAFSQGAVIWVYLSEIFPNRVRAQGQGLGSSTHWVMNALVSGVFPVIAARSQAGPFVFFLGMVVLQFIAVWFWFPETRGVSLERMQDTIRVGH
jgi:MFS transporter, SP family, arabinose:H+ symporter